MNQREELKEQNVNKVEGAEGVELTDLNVNNEEQAQVKGGPIYMQIEGVKGSVTTKGYEKEIQ